MMIQVGDREFDTAVYAVPEFLPEKEAFLAWLNALAEDHVFCSVTTGYRCDVCPIAQFTGKRATYDGLEGTWAREYMNEFDRVAVDVSIQTKKHALAAYKKVFP